MATPAIWRPPKFRIPGLFGPGRQTAALAGRGLFGNLGGKQTINSGILNLARGSLLGNTQQPGGGGGNPYAGILAEYMNQQRADFAAQSAAEKGDMINQIRKYMISYGSSPNFDAMGGLGKDAAGYLKQALDAKTLGLMQKNEAEGLSARARMQQANDKAVRMIPASRAAQGLLRSGQTGVDMNEQAMEYKRTGYDMLNELLGGITGTVSSFQNAERERARALAEAEMQAAMQAAGDWGDSYMGEEPSAPSAPGAPAKPKVTQRPPKPGPNYYWNGRRWVYRKPAGKPAGNRGGGAGGTTAKVQ